MNENKNILIESAAGKALAEWECVFSQQVLAESKILARKSGSPHLVTAEHFRQAAGLAVEKLLEAIKGNSENNGQQKVA